MALKLNFNIEQSADGQYLYFTETTGLYSAANLTGWESPNAAIADITTATLTIVGGNTSPTPLILDIYNIITPNGFPTSDNPSQPYVLDATITDAAASIGVYTDGLMTFTYTVYDATNDVYYHTTKSIVLLHTVECCVQKLFAKAAKAGCCEGCKNEHMEKALLGWTLLETLKQFNCDCNCFSVTDINKTLKTLQNLCANSKCGC